MKKILLTKGKITFIDDEDFDRVNKYKWCFSSGYAVRGKWKNGTTKIIGLHRFIMNAKKGSIIDHINHDTLDNRKSNLRTATKQQNSFNSIKPSNNTSGYKGVIFFRRDNNWRAVIKFNQKYIHIGYFTNIIDAAQAYNKKAQELFGKYANTL